MDNRKKREISWDIAKGICIITVILGHCIQFNGREYFDSGRCWDNTFLQLFYSINMPVFMIASGYFCVHSIRKYSFKDFLHSKFTQLIAPIITFSILELLCMDYSREIQTFGFLKFSIFLFVTSLWFLWTLFFCQVSLYVFKKYNINYFIIFILLILATLFVPNKITTIGWGESIAPEFFIGAMMYEHRGFDILQKHQKFYLVIFSIIFCILFQFYDRNSFVYTTGCYIFNGNPIKQIQIDVFRCTIGIVGSLALLLFIKFLISSLPNFKFTIMPFLGCQSMGLYIISVFIVMLEDRFLDYTVVPGIWNIPVNFTLTFLVSIFATLLIKRNSLLNAIFLGGK